MKLRVPERAPVDLGENVTEAVQLAPPASVAGHDEVIPKSARLLKTELIVSEED